MGNGATGSEGGNDGGDRDAGWHVLGAGGVATTEKSMFEYVTSSFGLFVLLDRMLSDSNFSYLPSSPCTQKVSLLSDEADLTISSR